jgi:putative Ca2+/H+ antiporter (TMEM165/GDT1 family)
LGQVTVFFPQHYVRWLAIALFFGFGFKMLYDAAKMARSAWLAEQKEAVEAVQSHEKKATSFSTMSILLEAFLLTFFAEWGDRTQIATITLATANHPLGVTLGATLGHGMATAIAVISGHLISGRLSERWLTVAGGCLFLIFGAVTAWKTP